MATPARHPLHHGAYRMHEFTMYTHPATRPSSAIVLTGSMPLSAIGRSKLERL